MDRQPAAAVKIRLVIELLEDLYEVGWLRLAELLQ